MKKLITGMEIDGTVAKSLIAQYGIQGDVVEMDGAHCPSSEFDIEDSDVFVVAINYGHEVQLHLKDDQIRFSFALRLLRGQYDTWTGWYAAGDSAYDPSADHRVVDQAYATCRVLEGSADSGYAEEWAERIEQSGTEYDIYYLFDDGDIINDDGTPRLAEDYPWNDDHISKIVEMEK